MSTNYVPIDFQTMKKALVDDMGFSIHDDPCGEYVFRRPVITKSGIEHPYTLLVYSSVDRRTGWTRDSGADAIRVVLIDNVTGNPARPSPKRVHRTKNALNNLRERCRAEFSFVLNSPRCPKCGSVMVEKENRKTGHKFLSCSRFAPKKEHHCTGTRDIPKSQ